MKRTKKSISKLKKFEVKAMSLKAISGGTATSDIIMDLTFEIK